MSHRISSCLGVVTVSLTRPPAYCSSKKHQVSLRAFADEGVRFNCRAMFRGTECRSGIDIRFHPSICSPMVTLLVVLHAGDILQVLKARIRSLDTIQNSSGQTSTSLIPTDVIWLIGIDKWFHKSISALLLPPSKTVSKWRKVKCKSFNPI